ncbi:cyclodehydratase [soil metagenome]
MVLRLDPTVPLVWRTPQSLQFGIDSPLVVLDKVSPATERMIAALVTGVSVSGLAMIASSAGGTGEESRDLVSRLTPVLERRIRPASAAVTVSGHGRTAAAMSAHLLASGLTVVPDGDRTAFAVIVADYVVEPELHGRWLRRDIPHLPVVFGDRAVQLGPMVEPGAGPCLYCLERHRTDSDAAWPAIASQLWGRRSPVHESVEGTLVEQEAAGIAARQVIQRLRNGVAAGTTRHESLAIEAESGIRSSRRWTVHPSCLCRSLTGEPSVELESN